MATESTAALKPALEKTDGEDFTAHITQAQQDATLRKIDWHIMPWSAWLYLLNYLDRTNMGSVKIANLEAKTDVYTQLGINDNDWQLAISIFFVGYIVLEIPSNLMIQRVGPSKWLSRIIVSWGIVALCMGFVQNRAGLIVTRFMLGICEAGYGPGMIFYFSIWYSRKEYAIRFSLWYCSATLAGAFGGLLAYGISFMNGSGGLAGWRWIFIFEGIPSIICGVLTLFILPNYPHTSKWLTEVEKEWCEKRMESNAPSARKRNFDKAEFLAVMTDPHAYLYTAIYMSNNVALQALTFWLPTIIKNLGYASTTALLMTVPPWLTAWFVSLAVSWNCDRTQMRVAHVLSTEAAFLVSLIMFAAIQNSPGAGAAALYFACFIATSATSAFVPCVWAWRTSTTQGTTGNATATALMNALGNIGGVAGPFVFRSDWAPSYTKAFVIMACLSFTCIVLVKVEDEWAKREQCKHSHAHAGDAEAEGGKQ
ncbi:MFS general substrate transporter [Gonapodya prolifera JEL478]|uniref:MFS general substrate transporter n=1 Tax=Gonapodya prolifera (strain JEL478) TaxID=1344416 RepID=A0A139AM85_GONPJ|nr:MFS general substrate transporter [Gonapodya prolifera JEL478]|eukprot:KXS17808.1 MFS general substrate transporter [Gonapodya prolifera JEL478]